MANYAENKKTLDKIRRDYNCAGDVIFRTALQMVVEHGQENFRDEEWYNMAVKSVNNKHDAAEAEGKILFCTRDFEIALIECAKAIACIEDIYDLLIYIQREVYLGGDGIDYYRAIALLKNCMSIIAYSHDDNSYTLEDFEEAGIDENELEELGFGYLIVEDEEE